MFQFLFIIAFLTPVVFSATSPFLAASNGPFDNATVILKFDNKLQARCTNVRVADLGSGNGIFLHVNTTVGSCDTFPQCVYFTNCNSASPSFGNAWKATITVNGLTQTYNKGVTAIPILTCVDGIDCVFLGEPNDILNLIQTIF